MMSATLKALHEDVKKLAKATGPTSEKGKLRSALNSVKHGLSGRNLLLPGEDAAAYEARMDGIFRTLAPRTEGEAELVALVADDLHKLGRLERMEHAALLRQVEQAMVQTDAGARGSALATAIATLGEALAAWETHQALDQWSPELEERLSDAVGKVERAVPMLPIGLRSDYEAARGHHLPGRADNQPRSPDAAGVFEAARRMMAWLLTEGDRADEKQDEARERLAPFALPDESVLKPLARYTKLIEESLLRRMTALERLRALASAQPATVADASRVSHYRVQLRVVE